MRKCFFKKLWFFGTQLFFVGMLAFPVSCRSADSGEIKVQNINSASPKQKQWFLVAGATIKNSTGNYGKKEVADPNNIPGARSGAAFWADPAGDFWIFGGVGMDSAVSGYLNDLWRYSNKQWVWVEGSNTINALSIYGTMGIPQPKPIVC